MSSLIKKRAVIIQEHMPHYRAEFFASLREALKPHGIELRLIHGISSNQRMISQALDWANPVKIRKIGPISWHHLGRLCDAADLIIVPQEIKYLRLHLLLLVTRFTQCKFAYWGHGKNFQATNPNSTAERLKRFLSRQVDWWFAYNDLSARIVAALGFPKHRITSVGNTVDTGALTKARDSVTESMLADVRKELHTSSDNIAIYTGALYAQKRIAFLLESAILIRRKIPDFELIVIGNGPDRHLVTKAASEHPWIHDLGPKNDREKVPYWALSKLLLMPGLVGLVVVDSFALGVPMVTTDYPYHSPEIDYLKHNQNGIVVQCGEDTHCYADEIAQLFKNPRMLETLRKEAVSTLDLHSINEMVGSFLQGVIKALDLQTRVGTLAEKSDS